MRFQIGRIALSSIRTGSLLVAATLLHGCSLGLVLPSLDFSDPEYRAGQPSVEDVLSNIPSHIVPVARARAPDAREVLALYEGVVDRIKDEDRRFQVARRIAELELEAATNTLGDSEQVSFRKAIDGLEKLLAVSVSNMETEKSLVEKAHIQYLLSQAYDLSGDQEASIRNLGLALSSLESIAPDHVIDDSRTLELELRFRRAEYYFSTEKHKAAAEDYFVVAQEPGNFQTHANYMLGWSRFKQGDLDHALVAFITTLEQLLGQRDVKPGNELLADTKRVMIITLDYLDGVGSLAPEMASRGKPEWQIELYRALADWYREKERFQDRARTLTVFLDENPLFADAPKIALEVIDTYRQAGFVDDIQERKLAFIDLYDKQSDFYQHNGEEVFADYHDTLMLFMDEAVAAAHAQAQATGSNYAGAAGWYRRWLTNFEGHGKTADNMLLLAETLMDGADTRASVEVYQALIDNYPDYSKLEQAAYAVVTGLELLATTDSPAEEMADIDRSRVEAGMYFSRRFPLASEAPATMVNVARILFDGKTYDQALLISEEALSLWDLGRWRGSEPPQGDLWQTAMRIAAHSSFESGNFALAESYYRSLIAEIPANEELKPKLLATILRLAELSEAKGDKLQAIVHLNRLSEVDRKARLAIDAQFDIATLYEEAGDLASAIKQLESFRSLHPGYQAAAEIPMRLVNLHEAVGDNLSAAMELRKISKVASHNPETRRQALYRSGEMFLAAGDTDLAISTFRDYAHTYEFPFPIRMEAMHHMDQLYQSTNEPIKRRFWLRKKKSTFDATSPELITDRSRYLAAAAAFELSLDLKVAFEQIGLKIPLKKSLRKKRKSMTAAIKAFEQTAAYGVADYASGSTFQIAGIYGSLANALMHSDKPKGLNELEAEQYDILLEEQAYPFEEQALKLHEINLKRGWDAGWDSWVSASLEALGQLSPGRFERQEIGVGYAKTLY